MFAPYLLSGWIVASFLALACGAAGFFVVVRRENFAAHALPMAAFPGAAAASLLGIGQDWGLSAAACFGAGLLLWLKRRQRNDAATALALSALLALGALLLGLSGRYANEVYALLFGQIFAVGPGAIPPAIALGSAVPLLLLLLFRPLALSALSPELAALRGVTGGLNDTLFLLLLALTAAFALPVTGALLAFSLMTGPAAAACFLCRGPYAAFALAMALALALIWSALALAYVTDWPPGFFTGTGAAALYLAARNWRRVRPAPPPPGAA